MASRFLSSLWKELRHSSIPSRTKWIVCSVIVLFFIATVTTGTLVVEFSKVFLSTSVMDAQMWHVLVLMLVGFLIFGRNHK